VPKGASSWAVLEEGQRSRIGKVQRVYGGDAPIVVSPERPYIIVAFDVKGGAMLNGYWPNELEFAGIPKTLASAEKRIARYGFGVVRVFHTDERSQGAQGLEATCDGLRIYQPGNVNDLATFAGLLEAVDQAAREQWS